MYNSKVDLHGTGNRSIIVHYVSKNNTLTFDHNFEAIMVVRGQSPWLGDKRRSPAEAESVVDPPWPLDGHRLDHFWVAATLKP